MSRMKVVLCAWAAFAAVGGAQVQAATFDNANLVVRTEKFRIERKTFAANDGSVLDKCVPAEHVGVERKILWFDSIVRNAGTDDFFIGTPPASEVSLHPFVWAPGHGHHHLVDFNQYDLLNSQSQFVKTGLKQSFCIIDWEPWAPSHAPARYTACTGSPQGIQVGWEDRYWGTPYVSPEQGQIDDPLDCQFIDITDVPDGDYRLVNRANALEGSTRFPESNIHDNAFSFALRIAGDAVTPLTAGWTGQTVASGGAVNTSVSAVSWAPNRIDVFARGAENRLVHKWWNGQTWSDWESLGGVINSRPHAVSWGPDHIDVFVRGTDNAFWLRRYLNGWQAWKRIGGDIAAPPFAVSWGPGRVDAFGVGQQGQLLHTTWDGAAWTVVASRGGSLMKEQPAAAAWGRNRIDVFGRGSANQELRHVWFDGTWHASESLGGVLASPPTVAAWNLNRLDVFVKGTDSAIWHKWFDNGRSGWESLGGSAMGEPRAVSWGPDRLDVFATSRSVRDDARLLVQFSWNGSVWERKTIGSRLPAHEFERTFIPAPVTWAVNQLSVFWAGDWGVSHRRFF
jgi:hypothetical protein